MHTLSRRQSFWAMLLVGFSLVGAAAPIRAERIFMTETRLNLRVDSLRTSQKLRVLPLNARLVSLGQWSDATGLYRVATTDSPADTGWVAAEYLLQAAPNASPGADQGATCGVARWSVKTMSDPDASDVDLTPVSRTISQLRSLAKPSPRPQNGRANQAEKTTYRVSGKLLKWGLEDDGDIHLVLASPSSATKTIVLEIPDADCVDGASSQVRSEMESARTELIDELGEPPSSLQALSPKRSVTVTGVGFFDQAHSTGHPPNAFELHPLLSIEFSH